MGKQSNSIKQALLPRTGISVLAGLSISLLTFSSVEALNVGQARTQSFLGQPLSIFVPVSDSGNIIDLNQLIVAKPSKVQLEDLKVSIPTNGLSYEVISKGTEKGILITTATPFNEPYINIGVKVDYQGVSQLSKLTVLIDLEPLDYGNDSSQTTAVISDDSAQTLRPALQGSALKGVKSSESVDVSVYGSKELLGKSLSDQVNNSTTQTVTYTNEIMGPYDWAQKSLIPEKFGPVLQGQSLWRVARRINEAMGVSIDQMMWALYRSNPEAFSGNDVSTLQSGSILSIPKESLVREVTELGAVRLLNPKVEEFKEIAAIKGIESIADTTAIDESSSQESNQVIIDQSGAAIETVDSELNEATNRAVSPAAQLSPETQSVNEGVEKAVNKPSQVESVVSLSKLNIVDELRSEIAYLNQQVVDQSFRIDSLERRLATAELRPATLTVSSNSISEGLVDAIIQPEVEVLPANIADVIVVEDVVENTAAVNNTVQSSPSFTASIKTYLKDNVISAKSWSLAALALFLFGFGYFARHKVMPLFLKIFGGRYEYDEESSFFDSVSKKRRLLRPLEESKSELDDGTIARESEYDVTPKKQIEQDEFEDYSFFNDDEELMDVEELSFPDRIKQLIDSGDFEEAKSIVKFASEANVNEHDVNVYLLKIFAAQSDREGFDILFDKIHANIDKYDANDQLMVAEIQSEMSIGKVINFNSGSDSEKKAS